MKLIGKFCASVAAMSALAAAPAVAVGGGAAVDSSAHNVVDEVIWVVGDEPILMSEVEAMRLQAAQEGTRWNGDPDCVIPEQLAVQKLYLHQAAIDSVDATESEIQTRVDGYVNMWIQQAGSREKLEEYRRQSISQIRNELHDVVHDQIVTERMRDKLVENVKVTPAEVRRFFSTLPQDSIPFVPTEVEVQILTQTPEIEQELSEAAGAAIHVQFTPHLIPMNRGILATCYARLREGVTDDDVAAAYSMYEGEKFIRLVDTPPETRYVKGTNTVDIGYRIDHRTGNIIAMGAIDNLVKGAAGQAVQNMNILFSLDEAEGLSVASASTF